jgi:hypothetical protein
VEWSAKQARSSVVSEEEEVLLTKVLQVAADVVAKIGEGCVNIV